jgi:hypothetical protein
MGRNVSPSSTVNKFQVIHFYKGFKVYIFLQIIGGIRIKEGKSKVKDKVTPVYA